MRLQRTERSHLSKSSWLETSIKKLGPLARQIAGKPVEEAIVQMRYSKKRVAKEVKKHLEYARDEAIVARGMGLGKVEAKEEVRKPVSFVDRDGKRRTVTDPTGIYVDQAWVGRGTYGMGFDYRARGRINFLKPPHTSTFSFSC